MAPRVADDPPSYRGDFVAEKHSSIIDEKDAKWQVSLHDVESNKEEEEENSPIPMVAATVSTKDDPSLPALTFRFWVLGTFFTCLGAALSEFYYFRANGPSFSILFVQLAAYGMGRVMYRVLPERKFNTFGWQWSFNPGPFNVKEHVLIAVTANAGGASAYATDILAIQNLYYGQEMGFVGGFLLLVTTQMMGYGMAGYLRKYLVRPASMVWPSTLVGVSLYNSLHGEGEETREKIAFFKWAFIGLFAWQFLPGFIFPLLSSIAVLCYINPNSMVLTQLGSSTRGLGMLNFSLDWNAITTVGPLFSPWWAQVNFYFGLIVATWIIAPLLYFNNVWDAQKFPLMSTHSFDKDGHRYKQNSIIDPATGSIDDKLYNAYSNVYISSFFAATYFFSLAAFAAAVSHVILFNGKDVWARFRQSRDEEEQDIHTKLMAVYPEIPQWWYALCFFSTIIVSIVLCYVYPTHLPWWGLLLAVALAVVMVLPIGVIQAISTNQLGLNVVTEMVCGYALPGRPIANVTFKCYGYMAMAQCLSLVSDLKLGHYMKIPPRAMFIAQCYGTIIGALVNYFVMKMIIDAKRPFLDGTTSDPAGQWAGFNSEIFNTASIIWGLIGPARMFGPGTMYSPIMWGFLFGILLPIPVYIAHRMYPNVGFDMINWPIICIGAAALPGANTNYIICGFIAAFISQFYCFRYRYATWTKYNYVLSAAFDSAAQICTMVIFMVFSVAFVLPMPEWWGNDAVSAEKCYGLE